MWEVSRLKMVKKYALGKVQRKTGTCLSLHTHLPTHALRCGNSSPLWLLWVGCCVVDMLSWMLNPDRRYCKLWMWAGTVWPGKRCVMSLRRCTSISSGNSVGVRAASAWQALETSVSACQQPDSYFLVQPSVVQCVGFQSSSAMTCFVFFVALDFGPSSRWDGIWSSAALRGV